jgi:murein DD-endopeptidase MepM/ murein hydrolase activator NlpD
MRLAAGAALLTILASCVAPSAEPAAPEAAAPAPPAPAPAPAPAAAPAPLAPLEISIEGGAVQGGLLRGRVAGRAAELRLGETVVPVDGDGRFILGFDRDHGLSARLVARAADGRTAERTIAVAPRAWAIEHINIARRPTASTEEYLRIRERELARIVAARAIDGGAEGWRQRFIWPARGRISGVFGSQRVYRGEPGSFHSGVDVAGGAGAPVVAPADGVVVLAGPPMFSLEGNLVIVDHGAGLNSAFLHLATTDVREGQRVRQGDRIGTIGATGRATGPHLHWSVKWKDARLDPALLAVGTP